MEADQDAKHEGKRYTELRGRAKSIKRGLLSYLGLQGRRSRKKIVTGASNPAVSPAKRTTRRPEEGRVGASATQEVELNES